MPGKPHCCAGGIDEKKSGARERARRTRGPRRSGLLCCRLGFDRLVDEELAADAAKGIDLVVGGIDRARMGLADVSPDERDWLHRVGIEGIETHAAVATERIYKTELRIERDVV